MKIGSDAHKALFCQEFITTHRRFEPGELPWPALSQAELARLRAIPFWQEVLRTERRAGAIVASFAKTIDDSLVRQAVDLQGDEEARHARLIRVMVDLYSIRVPESPVETLGGNIRTAFIDFGYGECIDAFLGFGLFKIARESGFLPETLFSIFDLLMQEETRHIVFFVNWMAYHQARHGRGAAPVRALTSAWYYGRALARLVGTARRGARNGSEDFTATDVSAFLQDFSVRRLVNECLTENRRRMNEFDHRLLQPRLLPSLARAVSATRLLPG